MLEAAGLAVQLVNAAPATNLPGRPKTDKLDAMGLVRLTELGLLRPSFVPPAPIRARQSGRRTRTGEKNQGDTWLRNSLGQAATGAARTGTFPGEQYHRIARRRGKAKAQVARSILVIIWQLAPARRPRRPVHRPRRELLPDQDRHRPQSCATISARSRPSASRSPSPSPPDPYRP